MTDGASARVAVVTGATSGIGLEIARHLARDGCRLVVNGLVDADEARALCTTLVELGAPEATFDVSDLTDPTRATGPVDEALSRFGAVDILINNAGIQHVCAVEEFPDTQWDRVVETNLNAPFRLIKRALPAMRSRGFGRIVNIASVHGLVASPFKSAYIAAKHGLVGLTKTVALETAGTGVTCNAVCPGYVRTELIERQLSKRAADQGLEIEEVVAGFLGESQPSGAFISAADVAALVGFLCSDAAA